MSVTSGPPARSAVEQRLSLFIDFENIALGVRDAQYKKFDIQLVLQRLIEKGRIVYKKAYADWTRYSEYKREFHEAAIELIDIPQRNYSAKNSADIRMVVDAMDLVSVKGHITTFVICSGDSDFSPLVSKLKENDKSVIGVGVKNSTSNLLISNCDEFIFYEDLVRETRALPSIESLPKKKQEVFRLVLDSLQALLRENYDVIWGSMVKQTMQRKQPYFNETYYGYKSFSELLEDAERNGLLTMKKDVKSGGYVVAIA
ncbi:MAG TPA: NYN domain-containing protein [Thermoanaerobaculia bacterium]